MKFDISIYVAVFGIQSEDKTIAKRNITGKTGLFFVFWSHMHKSLPVQNSLMHVSALYCIYETVRNH